MIPVNSEFIRWYGEPKVPSVTSVLMQMREPFYMESWKQKIGVQGYVDYMAKVMQRGTDIHKVCENFFLQNNHPIPTDPELQGFIRGFYTFIAQQGPKILPLPGLGYQIECKLYSQQLGYAGTVDFVCELDHVNTLIDWKTSSSPSVAGEMREKYCHQGVAYAILWNHLHPECQVERVMFVVLTNNRKNGLGDSFFVEKSEWPYYASSFYEMLVMMNALYNPELRPDNLLQQQLLYRYPNDNHSDLNTPIGEVILPPGPVLEKRVPLFKFGGSDGFDV